MGARLIVDNGNAVIGNIYGRKYKVEDKDGRVGIFKFKNTEQVFLLQMEKLLLKIL